MAENGFAKRQETDGTWSVINVYKSEPVTFKGHLQTKLSEGDADEVLGELRRKYMERHHEGPGGRIR